MVVTLDPVLNISTPKVTFYSVKLGQEQDTEYKEFCNKVFPNHQFEIAILNKVIRELGLRGAKPYYFKNEYPANALPIVNPDIKKKNKVDFGIRLYCIYISPSIVILLNGDIKTVENSPKKCPNVASHFSNAIKIAKKLQDALNSDFVRYKLGEIELDDDFELNI